jgi:hypothetical protein
MMLPWLCLRRAHLSEQHLRDNEDVILLTEEIFLGGLPLAIIDRAWIARFVL